LSGRGKAEPIRDTLTRNLTPVDVIASYAEGEYEILLTATSRENAEAITAAMSSELSAQDMSARIGIACFPADGTDAETLLGRACMALKDDLDEAPANRIIVVDRVMRDLHRIAQRVAHGNISVLLLGETGVGKE